MGSRIRLPEPVSEIYEAVAKLEALYPGRKFTPDGHLVGSIGEVIAAEAFDLELLTMSAIAHDARDKDGRDVQIKLTAGKSIALSHDCDRLIILRIVDSDYAELIYDGDGSPIWNAAGKMQSNGQRSISFFRINKVLDGTYP